MATKKSKTVTTQVRTRTKVAEKVAKLPGKLSEAQEKVIRMRRGIGIEDA